MRTVAVVFALACAGCSRVNEFSAPAPAGALECAVREAEDRGYLRVAGDDDAGYVRMSQRMRPPVADAPPPDDADRARRPPPPGDPERQLLVRYEGGVLRIEPIEPGESASRDASPGFASDHAAEIVTLCGSPA